MPLDITGAQGLPIHAVVYHAVGAVKQRWPGRFVRLVANDESIDEGLKVLASAGGANQSRDRMSGLMQMAGDHRSDESRHAGESNAHGVILQRRLKPAKMTVL